MIYNWKEILKDQIELSKREQRQGLVNPLSREVLFRKAAEAVLNIREAQWRDGFRSLRSWARRVYEVSRVKYTVIRSEYYTGEEDQ